jgi:hypothetical protein
MSIQPRMVAVLSNSFGFGLREGSGSSGYLPAAPSTNSEQASSGQVESGVDGKK